MSLHQHPYVIISNSPLNPVIKPLFQAPHSFLHPILAAMSQAHQLVVVVNSASMLCHCRNATQLLLSRLHSLPSSSGLTHHFTEMPSTSSVFSASPHRKVNSPGLPESPLPIWTSPPRTWHNFSLRWYLWAAAADQNVGFPGLPLTTHLYPSVLDVCNHQLALARLPNCWGSSAFISLDAPLQDQKWPFQQQCGLLGLWNFGCSQVVEFISVPPGCLSSSNPFFFSGFPVNLRNVAILAALSLEPTSTTPDAGGETRPNSPNISSSHPHVDQQPLNLCSLTAWDASTPS